MTDSRYLQVFGDATDALFRHVGVDAEYRKSGRSLYTVESHVSHEAEVRALDPIHVLTRVLAVDDKRVHLFHRLVRGRDDMSVATGEQIYLHVDTNAAKASSMDSGVHARLADLCAAQSHEPAPREAGRRIAMPAR